MRAKVVANQVALRRNQNQRLKNPKNEEINDLDESI
jgi:hypothetical protein